MNRGSVFNPVSRLVVNILYLHIVVKNPLTPKVWMRQVVEAGNNHTTCGVEAGTGRRGYSRQLNQTRNLCS
ncbi:MAG: hypothetical protein ACI85V_001457 [bacterium]|jgi:hypothetical protein